MVRNETAAAIRFGYGLGPRHGPVAPETLLSGLGRRDRAASDHPTARLDEALKLGQVFRQARKDINTGKDGAQDRYEAARADLQQMALEGGRAHLIRAVEGASPFRERLVWFWADHFTATPTNPPTQAVAPAYVDDAIRPHVNGRFSDMLRAVVTHPFMLVYLDQFLSFGPNSRAGKRRGKGLNENLARELLELHTLGVGGAYSQTDVRELAELLTGLTIRPESGFHYAKALAEPGAETVLGKTYGGRQARLEDVLSALDDLARHPDTARHLAHKIAVHFTADDPDPDLVAHLERAYRASDGRLPAVYAALFEHPATWQSFGRKAKTPFDFIVSAMVAIGVTGAHLEDLSEKEIRRFILRPLRAMGQPFMQAPGPDGWPEEAENWITPQGLATRISWSIAVAGKLSDRLPDPRAFLETTLADAASERLRFAVSAAETRRDGASLVLASSEFNRR